MKHIHNLRPLALAFILVVTGIAAAVCGLVMKGQLQKYVGGYDDKWAVAVPFLMLRDDTDWQRMLAAKNAPAPDPQPDPEPAPEPEPEPDPEPEPEPQSPALTATPRDTMGNRRPRYTPMRPTDGMANSSQLRGIISTM